MKQMELGELSMISFKGAQFPKEVNLFAVFFYVRYTVSANSFSLVAATQAEVEAHHAAARPRR